MKIILLSVSIFFLFSCNITERSVQSFPLPIEESDAIPPLLSDYCTSKSETGICDCENTYINISAYLDISNLPMFNRVTDRIIIISSPENYGHGSDMVPVFFYDDTLSNTFQKFLYDNAPVKVEIKEAQIIKEMVPTMYKLIPIWRLDTNKLFNISFYAEDENGKFKLLSDE